MGCTGNGLRLLNETSEWFVCLEVGSLSPHDDLKAVLPDGKWERMRERGIHVSL